MYRTSLLLVALVAIPPAITSPITTPKEGFRVYTFSLRCQIRSLVGVYPTPQEAFLIAAKHQGNTTLPRVEVTTGSEGNNKPTGTPMLFHVYTRACPKTDWRRKVTFADQKKATDAVKTFKADGLLVEVINDYAPREVYHVYGGGCRRRWRLLGTYVSMWDAAQAAKSFRTNEKLACDITTGTTGKEYPDGSPVEYRVFVEGCKGNWKLVSATKDAKKARETAQAQDKDARVEVLIHYAGK